MKIRLRKQAKSLLRFLYTTAGILLMIVTVAPGVFFPLWLFSFLGALYLLRKGRSSLYEKVSTHPAAVQIVQMYTHTGFPFSVKCAGISYVALSCGIGLYLTQERWIECLIAICFFCVVVYIIRFKPRRSLPRTY